MGFSPDAFDFTTEPTTAEKYMEYKLKEVLISGVIQNGDPTGDTSADLVTPDVAEPAVRFDIVSSPGSVPWEELS
jgi:hypothetical protein